MEPYDCCLPNSRRTNKQKRPTILHQIAKQISASSQRAPNAARETDYRTLPIPNSANPMQGSTNPSSVISRKVPDLPKSQLHD